LLLERCHHKAPDETVSADEKDTHRTIPSWPTVDCSG
jgi:hypothetical protein